VITIIEIASTAGSVFDKSCYEREAKAMNKDALLYLSFVGSKERPPMKKEATAKYMGLKTKTSDEKRGNPKTHGVQSKHLRRKNRQPQNTRGSKQRPPMKKGNPKMQGAQNKTLQRKKRQPPTRKGIKARRLHKTKNQEPSAHRS
jgi:hypothetical protein